MKRFLLPTRFLVLLSATLISSVVRADDDPPPDDWIGWKVLDPITGPSITYGEVSEPQPAEKAAPLIHALAASISQQGTLSLPLDIGLATTVPAGPNDLIAETARGLDYNWAQCYLFVRNQIRYTPCKGFMRGPERTLLDREGSDGDQAFLLLALLRMSGYTATVRYAAPPDSYGNGGFRIPLSGTDSGYDAAAWVGASATGTVDNVSDAIWTAMGQGGQKACFWPDDTPPSIVIEHFWVQMTLSNTIYNLDASFKPRRMSLPSALLTDMDYNRANFLTLAGGATNAYSVQGLNSTNLATELVRLSTNLVARWQISCTNATASALIGGDTIIPQDLATDTNTFHGTMNGTDIDFLTQSDAYKNSLRANLTVYHRGFTTSMWMDEIAARHLWIAYTNAAEVFPKAQLRLDDNIILATEPTGWTSSTDQPQIYTCHSVVGTSMTPTYNLSRALTNVYAIPIGFGGDHRGGMRDRAENDLGRLRASGLAETNILLRSHVLQLVGQQWLAQCALINELDSRIKGTHQHFFYDLGIAAQESAPYVDLKNTFTYSSADASKFDGFMLFSSALEHGVLDQVNGTNRPAVSTIRVMDLANASNSPIYLATQANWNSTVRPALTNYASGVLTVLDNSINGNGHWVLLPKNGKVVLRQWNGYGYIDKGAYTTALMIGGGLNGGFATVGGFTISGDGYLQYEAPGLADFSTYTPTSVDPVDMRVGASLVTRTDLTMSGPMPLVWTRHYDSRTRWVNGPLGRGWTHGYDTKVNVHADPDAFFGRGSPVACIPSAVASAVVADLLAAGENAKNMTVACLVVKWWTDQLVDGAVTVKTDNQALSFARKPDGAYAPSPGVTATFVKNTNGQFTLQERLGRTWTFATNGVLSRVTDPSGNFTACYYTNATGLVAVSNSFGQKCTLSWSGSHVSSVSDTSGRNVSYRYNPTGCLTGVTDAAGFPWKYSWDTNAVFLSETDPAGFLTVSNSYNTLAQVTNQLSANGYNWPFAFAAGVGAWECDPFTNRIFYSYTEDGRLAQRKERDGSVQAFYYDGQGQIVSNIDALGRVTLRAYDAQNNLTSVTEAANTANARTTAFVYDNQNRLVTISNALGRATRMTYDSYHRLTSRTTPDGTVFTNVYDSHGLPTSTTVLDASGRQLTSTSFGYDSRGFATTISSTDAGTVQIGYDNAGNVTNIVDALTHPTRIFYDPRGFATNILNALNGRTVRAYNSAGRLTTAVDPLLHTNSFLWSVSGHAAGVCFPNGGQTTNEYDVADRLSAVKNARGNRVTLELDSMGRVIRRSTPNWQEQSWYDKVGCVTSRLDSVSSQTDIGYDGLSRPYAVVDPMNRLWQTGIDPLNAVTNSVDARERVTRYTLDSMGRRVRTIYPSGRTEGFAFDALGRQTAFTNSEGHVYRMFYDGQGRLIAATNAANEQVFRNYFDSCGNLTNKVDGASRPIRFQYDTLNHCTNTVYSDTSFEAFAFDAVGNLLTAKNAATTNTFGYSNMNQLTVSVSRVGGITFTNLYRYDLGGLATNVVYPDGKTVRYAFDPDGNVTNVTDWANHTWRIARDAAGRVTTLAYPNNVTGAWGYDASSAVTNWSYTGGGGGLPGRGITRDVMGLKKVEKVTSGPMPVLTVDRRTENTFNTADRLVTAQVYTGTNQVTQTFLYNACGALTNQISASVSLATYSYDLAGRLTSTTASNLSFSASYDALGNRVKTTVNGTTRLWVIDHTDPLKRPLMETTTNGIPVRYYVWGAGRLLAVIDADGTTRYAHCDDFGSVVALSDANGATVFTAAYGPYGEPWESTGTNATPFRWLGGHGVFAVLTSDLCPLSSGLYLTRHRAYDTTLKRFIQQDPIGLSGGANLYCYALGNPLSFVDPLGLCAESGGGNYGYGWWDSLAGRSRDNANYMEAANNAAYPWVVAGALNTIIELGTGVLSTPKQIGHLGEGSGTFAGDPSWETAPGMLMDVSTTAGALAGGMSAGAAFAETIANPVPSTVARVIAGEGPFPTLGLPGSADVFVTDAAAIRGMTPAQIGPRLGIPVSDTFTVIEFPTPLEGLSTPVFRSNPGFVGRGVTSGGAPEFAIPNGPIPPGATTTILRSR